MVQPFPVHLPLMSMVKQPLSKGYLNCDWKFCPLSYNRDRGFLNIQFGVRNFIPLKLLLYYFCIIICLTPNPN